MFLPTMNIVLLMVSGAAVVRGRVRTGSVRPVAGLAVPKGELLLGMVPPALKAQGRAGRGEVSEEEGVVWKARMDFGRRIWELGLVGQEFGTSRY